MSTKTKSKPRIFTRVSDYNTDDSFWDYMKFIKRPDVEGTEYHKDPRGIGTKFGVTDRAFPDVDVENLTEENAHRIYKSEYWDKMGLQNVPFPMNVLVMDAAVNQGLGAARQMFKSSNTPEEFIMERIKRYHKTSEAKGRGLDNYQGWVNRVGRLLEEFQLNDTGGKVTDDIGNESLTNEELAELREDVDREMLGDEIYDKHVKGNENVEKP